MSKSSNKNSGGISFLGLLGIVFITLKLCKIIDWSWWCVTMPLWGGVVLFLFGFVLFLIYKLVQDNKYRIKKSKGS